MPGGRPVTSGHSRGTIINMQFHLTIRRKGPRCAAARSSQPVTIRAAPGEGRARAGCSARRGGLCHPTSHSSASSSRPRALTRPSILPGAGRAAGKPALPPAARPPPEAGIVWRPRAPQSLAARAKCSLPAPPFVSSYWQQRSPPQRFPPSSGY